jgi:hypothetical protein
MPAVIPANPGLSPGTPPAIVPASGTPTPGVPVSFVPTTPGVYPADSVAPIPELPTVPPQPENYARRGAQNLTGGDVAAWGTALGVDRRRLKVAFSFLGDSIMTENGLGSSYVANQLVSRNPNFFGATYEDRAVVGRKYSEVLAALATDLVNLNATKQVPIVVVGTGVNSIAAGVPVATVLSVLQSF